MTKRTKRIIISISVGIVICFIIALIDLILSRLLDFNMTSVMLIPNFIFWPFYLRFVVNKYIPAAQKIMNRRQAHRVMLRREKVKIPHIESPGIIYSIDIWDNVVVLCESQIKHHAKFQKLERL